MEEVRGYDGVDVRAVVELPRWGRVQAASGPLNTTEAQRQWSSTLLPDSTGMNLDTLARRCRRNISLKANDHTP